MNLIGRNLMLIIAVVLVGVIIQSPLVALSKQKNLEVMVSDSSSSFTGDRDLISLVNAESESFQDEKEAEIKILTLYSHPQAGDNWTVFFETKGVADLIIFPEDKATIDDLDFVSLFCGNKERTPQILENDVIFYPNWFCEKEGKIVHLVNKAGKHTLKFQFGKQIAYAYNSGWVSPTSYEDPESKWSSEPNSYDGDIGTYAQDESNRTGWGAFLVLNLSSPINSDKIRVYSDFGYGYVDSVDVDVYNGTWIDAYEGEISNCAWTELSFTEVSNITALRFRYHYTKSGCYFWLYEIQIWEKEEIILPTVTTNDATSVEENSAILQGFVENDGGEGCQYRFVYGETTDYGFSTSWAGSVTTNDNFSEFISGLDDGKTYHFRAELKNSAGTSYGSDKTFTTGTAPNGWVSPTGFDDPNAQWENEERVFDDNTVTYARALHEHLDPDGQWSFYIYLTHSAINSNKIRFFAEKSTYIDSVDVDVYRDGLWTDVYEGSFNDEEWMEKSFAQGVVTKARIRFHVSSNQAGLYWHLYEFDFYKTGPPSSATMASDNYRISASDINVGGHHQTSNNYKMSDTIGEIATGISSSTNYRLKAGYQQMVSESYLSISSPSDVVMSPSIPGLSGGTATGEAEWTVITDNPAGYSLMIEASTSPAMQGQTQGDSFADYTEVSSGIPDYDWSVADSTAEFGFTPEGNDIVQKFKDNGSDSCNTGSNDSVDKCWYHFSTSQETVCNSYSANHPSGTSTTIKFKAQLYNADGVPNNEAGVLIEDTYQATITVTALAN